MRERDRFSIQHGDLPEIAKKVDQKGKKTFTHKEYIQFLCVELQKDRCDGDLIDVADILGFHATVPCHGTFCIHAPPPPAT